MKKNKSIEEEINEFIDFWDLKKMNSFMEAIIDILQLYDVDEEDDWVQRRIGGDASETQNVRMIRTVYLMSKFAEFNAGRLCMINACFKNLWKKMEKEVNGHEKK